MLSMPHKGHLQTVFAHFFWLNLTPASFRLCLALFKWVLFPSRRIEEPQLHVHRFFLCSRRLNPIFIFAIEEVTSRTSEIEELSSRTEEVFSRTMPKIQEVESRTVEL